MKMIEVINDVNQTAIPVDKIKYVMESKPYDRIVLELSENSHVYINVESEKLHYLYTEILMFITRNDGKFPYTFMQINEKGAGGYYKNLTDGLPDAVF